MMKQRKAYSLPRESRLDRRRYLFQNQILLHLIHAQLDESVPVLLAEIVFVHIGNNFFDCVLKVSPSSYCTTWNDGQTRTIYASRPRATNLAILHQRQNDLTRQHRHIRLPNLLPTTRYTQSHADLDIGELPTEFALFGVLPKPPVLSEDQSRWVRLRSQGRCQNMSEVYSYSLWEGRSPTSTAKTASLRSHTPIDVICWCDR